jgi:hypothetical protein
MGTDPNSDLQHGIELPAPTNHPLYLALGLTLGFAGLVTNELVSIVGGVVAVFGAIGWWRDVLPHAKERMAARQTEAEAAAPIVPRPRTVEHLVAGQATHRLRLPIEVRPLAAGLRGGLAGAVAMAVAACTYGLVAHGSPWLPINLLAGTLLPGLDAAPLEQLVRFDGTAFAIALVVHGTLSLLTGVVYAALLPMLPGNPLFWGGIVAPLAWTGLAGSAMGLINPALQLHVSWPWFVASQVAFGLTAGVVIGRAEPVRTLQSLSLAERAGLEADGVTDPQEEPE